MEDKKPIYKCEKCNYTTILLNSYKKHCETILHKTGKRKIRSDKKAENHKCDKCNYETTNKLNMKTHILNNHSSKEDKKKGFNYYCEKCDVGVFTETSYKIHLDTQKHKMRSA
jgi:hypothetical protein